MLMIEAAQKRDKRFRTQKANEVSALIVGYRTRRPNLKQLQNDLLGLPTYRFDISGFADMIAESRARVRSQKEAEACHPLADQ